MMQRHDTNSTLFWHSVRIFVHGIVTIPCFDTFIMIIIILSSITLAAEDPVQETSQRNHVLTYFDYVFTGIFALEMFLKVSSGHILCILNWITQSFGKRHCYHICWTNILLLATMNLQNIIGNNLKIQIRIRTSWKITTSMRLEYLILYYIYLMSICIPHPSSPTAFRW